MSNKQTLSLQFDIIYLRKKCLFEDADQLTQTEMHIRAFQTHAVKMFVPFTFTLQSKYKHLSSINTQPPNARCTLIFTIYPPPLPNITHIQWSIDRWIILISWPYVWDSFNKIQPHTFIIAYLNSMSTNLLRTMATNTHHSAVWRWRAGGRQIWRQATCCWFLDIRRFLTFDSSATRLTSQPNPTRRMVVSKIPERQ